MKKNTIIIFIACLFLLFSACGQDSAKSAEPSSAQITGGSASDLSELSVETSSDPAEEEILAVDSSDSSDPEVTEDRSISTEEEDEIRLLTDPSVTVGDLKAVNYSRLKTRAALLADRLLNVNFPMNTYNNSFFHHSGALLSYDEEGYESLLGVDVSVFQGEIDWKKVKEQGISFAIIRAGYRGYGESGSLNEDERFRENIEAAKDAGLLVGTYFFSQALDEEEAKEEAEYAMKLLEGIELDLPLAFDEEIIRGDDARTDAMQLGRFNDTAKAFFEVTEAAGYQPMLYMNLLAECVIYDLEQFADVPVWYAGYNAFPLTPYHFDFWQYTESGTLEGIDGPVDLNIWIRKTENT